MYHFVLYITGYNKSYYIFGGHCTVEYINAILNAM